MSSTPKSEITSVKNCGSCDTALEEHVEQFLQSVGKTLRFTEMKLDSPEAAKSALAKIEIIRQEVAAHRKTAQALKHLMQTSLPGQHDSEIVH